MTWFRKLPALLAVILIGAAVQAAKKDEKPKAGEKSEKKKDGDKTKDQGGKPEAKDAATPSPEDKSRMSVPLPVGHDARKLVIPYRDADGKLQMRFVMDVGRRVDPDHLEMTQLLIETFDSREEKEMSIDLPNSLLNLNTRVISTQSGATIKRADFELHGETMEFNTGTQQGRLGGKVHMKIYNLQNETNPIPAAQFRAK